MIDDAIDKLSSNEDGQQADVGALVHDGAKTNDTAELKASSPKKRVAKASINRTRRRQLRNRCQPDADEWSDDNSFLERLPIVKQDFESTNAPTALKHLLHLQAKLAVIVIVLSAETQEAVQRVRANF